MAWDFPTLFTKRYWLKIHVSSLKHVPKTPISRPLQRVENRAYVASSLLEKSMECVAVDTLYLVSVTLMSEENIMSKWKANQFLQLTEREGPHSARPG